MFAPLSLSLSPALSEARCLQNPVRMLLRNVIGDFSISDVLGRNCFAKSTRCLAPASYCLAIQEYQSTTEYFPSHHDFLTERYSDSALRSLPRSAWIKADTPEARVVGSTVAPVVVHLCFAQANRILEEGVGTIIDPDGIILTCAHLLGSQNSAEALKEMTVLVTLDPSQVASYPTFEGTILYADFLHDIAIIKIKPSAPLKAAKLGSAKELCSRDVVLSAGRYCDSSIDNYPQLIAQEGRYISGHIALFGELLAVTCPIDGGNDGGPLFNCSGEVVGLLTKNLLATSIDVVSKVLEHFKKHWRVILPQVGGTLGETLEGDKTYSDVSQCVRVVKVTPESVACCGDVVTEFDGKSVGSFQEFMNIMWDKVGKPLKMVVKRKTNMSATLTVVPDEARLDTHDRNTTDPLYENFLHDMKS